MRRALAIDENTRGPEHPSVARTLNNLGPLLQATNRATEAEPLLRRALAIYEKSFGVEHPNVATGLNNLAQVMQATNRLSEAEPLMRRALAISEKSFGAEHPEVAIRINNLARLLQDTNRLAEAEPLMRRALAISEKSFGPEHPDIGIKLNNLAGLLTQAKRLRNAEPLLRRARWRSPRKASAPNILKSPSASTTSPVCYGRCPADRSSRQPRRSSGAQCNRSVADSRERSQRAQQACFGGASRSPPERPDRHPAEERRDRCDCRLHEEVGAQLFRH
jgi:tetratricopeptide (TPR) repeat protein